MSIEAELKALFEKIVAAEGNPTQEAKMMKQLREGVKNLGRKNPDAANRVNAFVGSYYTRRAQHEGTNAANAQLDKMQKDARKKRKKKLGPKRPPRRRI